MSALFSRCLRRAHFVIPFPWCVYFFWRTGKMGAPWGWYGEEERTKPVVLKRNRSKSNIILTTPPNLPRSNNNFSPRPSESTSGGRGRLQHFLYRAIMTDSTLSFPVMLARQKPSFFSVRVFASTRTDAYTKVRGHGSDPERSARPRQLTPRLQHDPGPVCPATNHHHAAVAGFSLRCHHTIPVVARLGVHCHHTFPVVARLGVNSHRHHTSRRSRASACPYHHSAVAGFGLRCHHTIPVVARLGAFSHRHHYTSRR